MSRGEPGFVRQALFNGNGIARKLIVALVLFSSLITAVITAVELYAEYRRDRGRIDESIAFIRTSFLPALAASVWVADEEQLKYQLDGLLRLPDLEFIGISVDGRTRWSVGEQRSRRSVNAELPISYQHRGQQVEIGRLRVVASVDAILGRLWQRLLIVLVGNGLKTLIVAFFMLLVFQWLVTRHLSRIAAFVRRLDPGNPTGEPLRLDRPETGRWRPDMLDAISNAISKLSGALQQAREQVAQEEVRLRALTEQSTAYIYEIDRDGRIAFANRTYAGLQRDDVIGSKLAEWFPATLRPMIDQTLERVFAGQGLQRMEYAIPDLAGQVRSYLAALAPVEQGGAVAAAALTAIDVTEQKTAEAQVRELNATLEQRVDERTQELALAKKTADEANRAKSEFLSSMSHELRTPLNAVLGFAQLLEHEGIDAKHRTWVHEIRRAGDHLLQLISDLLDLSRIEAGQLTVRPETVDVDKLIERSLSIVRPLMRERGVALVELPGATHHTVRADPLRLNQILVNLLSNATKYNRDGGKVAVRCEVEADRVRILVEDTGRGLTQEQMARLFQPFERLGAERTAAEGTGIGLALSRRLAELMGASVGARSTPGVGSVFWVEVPRSARAEPADARAAPAAAPPEPAARARRLLCVEDNAANLRVITDFLGHQPSVRVTTATTGEIGLEIARRERPDLVLLDIHLPGIDGFAVLAALRSDPATRGIPVVALSADALPAQVGAALDRGFDRYLTKPLDLALLWQSIVELLPSPQQ